MAKVSSATARENSVTLTIVEYDETQKLLDALETGLWMAWQLPTWAAAVYSAVLPGLLRHPCIYCGLEAAPGPSGTD